MRFREQEHRGALSDHPIIDRPSVRPCIKCKTFRGVRYRSSMTDPNRPIELCEKCWEEYDDYWNERCEDYRRSQGRTPGTPGTPGKAGSIEGYGVIGFTDSYPELDSYPDELPES